MHAMLLCGAMAAAFAAAGGPGAMAAPKQAPSPAGAFELAQAGRPTQLPARTPTNGGPPTQLPARTPTNPGPPTQLPARTPQVRPPAHNPPHYRPPVHHHHHDYHHRYYHPALGALAIGAVVRSVPPSCVRLVIGGLVYFRCDDVWLELQPGPTVTYVVVKPFY